MSAETPSEAEQRALFMPSEPGVASVTARLNEALRRRFEPPTWALLYEVAAFTGAGAPRRADAIAMNLWPSQGLELWGIEVKAHRNDWLREAKNPSKAEPVARYCDRWWVVAAPGVVLPDELPPTWGLMELRGGRLHTLRQAEKRSAVPIERAFLAALLRRSHESSASDQALKAAYSRGVDDAARDAKAANRRIVERLEQDKERLSRAIQEFEQASGLRITEWGQNGRMGEVVRFVMDGGLHSSVARLRRLQQDAAAIVEATRLALARAEADAKDSPTNGGR